MSDINQGADDAAQGATQAGDYVASEGEQMGEGVASNEENEYSNLDNAGSDFRGYDGSAGGDVAATGTDIVAGADVARTAVGDFLGGGLQKAYILIIPSNTPGGPAAAMAMATASLAAEDAAGSAANNSALQTAESYGSGTITQRVEFFFNPTQYTIEKFAMWSHMPDQGSYPTAAPQWVGSGQRSLSVEIFLDATTQGVDSVQGDIDILMSALRPSMMSIMIGRPLPPYVLFGWGENLAFLAYMESVRAEFQLFKSDGTPIRANCSLQMKEVPLGILGQNPTSGGAPMRSRTTVAGDSLQSLSYREFGKPTMWRAIAETNGVEDPTRVAPGTTFLIPTKSTANELA